MIMSRKKSLSVDLAVLIALLMGLVFSFSRLFIRPAEQPSLQDGLQAAQPLAFQPLEAALPEYDPDAGLFVGELRVVAVGSAYPIPYEADVCPFSGIPQPKLNQLDRDSDGMTDDWEIRYGLDKYSKRDAGADLDDDGFTNLEEFLASTDPQSAVSHPPYAEKLRFVERKEIDFPLIFQGFMEQSDGNTMFQLNNPKTGKSHFVAVGDEVEGLLIERFKIDEEGRDHRLYVMRDQHEIELLRGETALDPESTGQLINILDRSSIMVTMGALLSLHNDEYIVLGVYEDRVTLKNTATGTVYDIVGFADGEQ